MRIASVILLALTIPVVTLAAEPRIEERSLAVALHAAADSLFERVDDTGRFRYRIDRRGRERGGYNIVRHAGALWVMQDYYRRYPDPVRAETLNRASLWLEHCCLGEGADTGLTALWSKPEGHPDEAKLGAAGLALAAWNGMAREGLAHPAPQRLDALAEFILYLQKPDGSFHSKFRRGRREDHWVSLYYPGEAALGLLAQHHRDTHPLWHAHALTALQFLARSRASSGEYLSDHWALIATAELARIERRARPELVEHTAAVTRLVLAEQTQEGAFGHELRTAPTATRLELLAAARTVLPNTDPLGALIDEALTRGNRFLLRTPRNHAPLRGAVPRAAAESSDARRDELRIDDTQHALAVWLAECTRQKYSCARP